VLTAQLKNGKKIFIITVCMTVLAGCSILPPPRVQHSRNYSILAEKQSIINTPMISFEARRYRLGRRVEGVSESKDFWRTEEYPARDSYKEELIYKGRTGNTIFITYKREDFPRPAIYNDLTFDLDQSDTFMARNYRIRVLEATDNYIRFMVLED
jgi:hypothetical protein